MKLRKKEKANKSNRADLHKALDLCLDINGVRATNQELTGNRPTAFFSVSGHVGICTIEIYPEGWSHENTNSIRVESVFAPEKKLPGDMTPSEMVDKIKRYISEG